MKAATEPVAFAWEPLSPRGVAVFAYASWGRLLLVQFIVAVVAAIVAVWFLASCWFPTIQRAIGELPSTGVIRSGQLDWKEKSPRLLAEGRYLAIDVDLNHSGQIRAPADVQVEFGGKNLRVYSLLGYMQTGYPQGWMISFNRTELEPWWNAWKPALLAAVAMGIVAFLFVSWMLLATAYYYGVWLVGFYTNRNLGTWESWKLAGAALMPGALFLTTALVFYGLGMIDLIKLGGALCLHLVLGWIYLFLGLIFLPHHPEARSDRKNPFSQWPA